MKIYEDISGFNIAGENINGFIERIHFNEITRLSLLSCKVTRFQKFEVEDGRVSLV